jgi:hypothetical protein
MTVCWQYTDPTKHTHTHICATDNFKKKHLFSNPPPTPPHQVKHDLLEFHDLHVAELYGARNRSHHEVDLVITLGGACVRHVWHGNA